MHLSDMHFVSGENYTRDNINGIVSALNSSIANIAHVLIIVSGDLSYSGKESEYKSVKKFFGDLKKCIIERYGIQDVRYVMVPGNHDVDYNIGVGDRGRDGLDQIQLENNYDNEIKNELAKMEQFFYLAGRYYCFINKNILHKKTITYDSVKIMLNLVNTAAFSSNDEDQGYHFIRHTDIERLAEQDDCDFVISVMHHPHHWFSWRCKKELESALYTRSDMVFVGHEHYESSMKVESENSSVNIFAGGELCNKGNWDNSEFSVAILDSESREYISRKYVWNKAKSLYREADKDRMILSENRYNCLGLTIKPEFEKELVEDKFLISTNIMSYFVFPLLEEECITDDCGRLPKNVDTMESFIETLNIDKKIIISGTNDSGKSILARAIYRELLKDRITLFLRGADIGRNFERTIKSAFEDAYSSDSSMYELFQQTNKDKLAVVIDDVDSIDVNTHDAFLNYVGDRFGLIVETCLMDIDIDMRSRLKKRSAVWDFSVYRIAPFYANKRKELVTNVVRQVTNLEDGAQNHIINMLCDVLSKQKYLYGWNPEFIVQFAKYYCNNIGEAAQNDGSVFSKVFEANLTQLIKPYIHNITVDKVFMILDKVAYGIYVQKCYPFKMADIDKWIDEYNNDYDSQIDSRTFVNMLLDARVLKQIDDKYYFYDRNYLSYFTAREIKRKCLEDDDYSQFEHVMNYCYSGVNTDILLFITYIVDNRTFIGRVMEKAQSVIQEWEEFDLNNIDIPFLIAPVEQIVKPYEEGDREKAEEKQIEQEKREVQSMVVANDETIFLGEKEELDYVQMVIRSISLMVIISRTLPSFEHLMKKEDKEECVRLIYSMPLRIFETIAKEINDVSSELIQDIKYIYETEFRNEKPNVPRFEDQEALYVLKWEATSLLLDLINAAVGSATRDNTNAFIDRFPYSENTSYRIEHLLGLARRDSVAKFSSEAVGIYSSNKEYLTKTIVQRITRNYIVNSRKIKLSEIQSLNAKIFKQSIPQQRITIERGRNKRKE